jgi:hypothetical protein
MTKNVKNVMIVDCEENGKENCLSDDPQRVKENSDLVARSFKKHGGNVDYLLLYSQDVFGMVPYNSIDDAVRRQGFPSVQFHFLCSGDLSACMNRLSVETMETARNSTKRPGYVNFCPGESFGEGRCTLYEIVKGDE